MLVCLIVTLLLPWMILSVLTGWQQVFRKLGFGGECARPPRPTPSDPSPGARAPGARTRSELG